MHAVALRRDAPPAGEPADEERLRSLALAAGVSPYELAMRLRVLGGAAGVLATFAGRAAADRTAAALSAGGVRAWVMPGRVEQATATVRSFSFEDGRLCLRLDGSEQEIAAADVRMLLHGVRHRERPSPRALPLRAGLGSWAAPLLGLSATPPPPTVRPEPFLYAFASGGVTLAFHAASLHYGALSGAIEPTRTANFQRVVQRLREGCPQARFDDRLRRWTEQARVLGPTLRPERYLELAIALVVDGEQRPRSPYR